MKSKMEKSSEKQKTYSENMIDCEELIKFYMADGLKVMALQEIDFTVKKGEMMAVIGKSGSGKSTLLNMIGCLDTPTAGRLFIDGVDVSTMSSKDQENFRKKKIGFVWQNSLRNLFPYMTVIENVMAPMSYMHMSGKQKKKRAMELLDSVGMVDKAKSFPLKLSGGQQQRVGIAVALANNPTLLLADEPTGAVDRKTSLQIMALFSKLCKEQGITIVIVTHDMSIADKVDRVVEISDGKISTETIRRESATFTDEYEDSEHDRYSVLDRANRVKLSDEVLEEAGITGKHVIVEVEHGKIMIRKKTK